MRLARSAGAETVEINSTETRVSDRFDRQLIGPATVEVTRRVAELLAAAGIRDGAAP